MPVLIIVVWEIPIWLLVLAGLCVLGVSAYEYIPIICAVVTFLIALVSISVSASSTLEKRNAAQLVGLKKGLRWVFTILMSFNVSSAMFYGMQYYVQKISGDIIGRTFSFIEMGVNNIPVFIGVSFFLCCTWKAGWRYSCAKKSMDWHWFLFDDHCSNRILFCIKGRRHAGIQSM